jgi:hypothetical protein
MHRNWEPEYPPCIMERECLKDATQILTLFYPGLFKAVKGDVIGFFSPRVHRLVACIFFLNSHLLAPEFFWH